MIHPPHQRRCLGILTILACILTAITMSPTARAAPPNDLAAGETVYRLNDAATYEEGCFKGCYCFTHYVGSVRGTFVLGPLHVGDAVNFREVREVNWIVRTDNAEFHVRGEGVYRITNHGPPHHSLELDLSIDGEPVEHFFSGFLPVKNDQASLSIPVSMNGMICYDTVFTVDASPVPAKQIRRYRLGNASTYQQGCWDPCDCLLEDRRPLAGRFGLVDISRNNATLEFAVVQASFTVHSDDADHAAPTLVGCGVYELQSSPAGDLQRMVLALHDANTGPLPLIFDSELVPADPIFPRINVLVDMNDMVCYDRVLDLHASPAFSNATRRFRR